MHAFWSKARPGRGWETSRYVSWLSGALLAVTLAAGAGCQTPDRHILERQTVEVACATCIFKMEGVRGCHWAIKLDGKPYLMEGALPQDHKPHSPEGMCSIPRRAVVDGELKGGHFVVERFDLLPATNVPGRPTLVPGHQH